MAFVNVFTLNLDLKENNYISKPVVTSHDSVRFIVNVTDDGLPVDLTNLVTATISHTRPDGIVVLKAGTKTGTNQMTFDLGSTETSVAGRIESKVQMYDADDRISTLKFGYTVTEDPSGDGYIPSEDDKTLIEQVLGDGPEILADAQEATENANNAADNANEAVSDIQTAEASRVAAENVRASQETGRVNAEATRVSHESSRSSAETSRETAEATRVTQETGRVSAESSRVTAESTRVTQETGRVTAESSRVVAETTRKTQEIDRVAAESARSSEEDSRVAAETTRESQETGRVSAEADRVSEETNRASQETERTTAETSRETAEATRVTQEADRVTAESERVSQEESRVSEETNRETQEAGRVTAEDDRVTAENTRVSQEAGRVTAEDDRETAEATRVTQEADRVTAESERVSEEESRVTAETNRETQETGRVGAEADRVAAENTRVSQEESRVTAEADRVTSESTRVSQESGRVDSEIARASAEGVRDSNEDTRIGNEATRESNEMDRTSAESGRVTSETVRETAEGLRVSAESARGDAEDTRNTNESLRQSNETTRETNETTRQSQETSRQTNTATAIQAVDDLIDSFQYDTGEYDAEKQYKVNNLVTYNGTTYICILDSIGHAPDNTTYWRVFAARGVDGTGSVNLVQSTSDDIVVTNGNTQPDLAINPILKQKWDETGTGLHSHAEGEGTYAVGDRSHSEGFATTTSQPVIVGPVPVASVDDTLITITLTLASADLMAAGATSLPQPGDYIVMDQDEIETDSLVLKCISYDETTLVVDATELLNYLISAGLDTLAEYLPYAEDGPPMLKFINLITSSAFSASHSEGVATSSYKMGTHAEGIGTTASEEGAHSEGRYTIASGKEAHAEGYYTTASGFGAHSEGRETLASGSYSHAEGYKTTASAQYAHSEGSGTLASARYTHAEGWQSIASAEIAHAEGNGTTASGTESHSEGHYTTASGPYAHSEGYFTMAGSRTSHSEGHSAFAVLASSVATISAYDSSLKTITVDNVAGFAVGNAVTIKIDNAKSVDDTIAAIDTSNKIITLTTSSPTVGWAHVIKKDASDSYGAHSEGYGSLSSGASSHAEGNHTISSGQSSHAEGEKTKASGSRSHAEGYQTIASGINSHSEGQSTTASGQSAHVEGNGTKASGYSSHAEGNSAESSGDYSHAEGSISKATGNSSHAEGYGTTSSGLYSHSEGRETIAGGRSSHAEGEITTAYGNGSHAEGYHTFAIASSNSKRSVMSFDDTLKTVVVDSASGLSVGDSIFIIGDYNSVVVDKISAISGTTITVTNYTPSSGWKSIMEVGDSGVPAHSEGKSTMALGSGAHAEGVDSRASADTAHAEGNGTIASGTSSHSEGSLTVASADTAHAEGSSTVASGVSSHAEGVSTRAALAGSHSEGEYSVALGEAAHAEGYATEAIGAFSHTEGYVTESFGQSAHAEGANTLAGGVVLTVVSRTASSITVTADDAAKVVAGTEIIIFGLNNTSGLFMTSTLARATVTSVDSNQLNLNISSLDAFDVIRQVAIPENSLSFSHSEGYGTIANGQASHAEGANTQAGGQASHAEGYSTKALGLDSHSEGYLTRAYGNGSHAEGNGSKSGIMEVIVPQGSIQSYSGNQTTLILAVEFTTGNYESLIAGKHEVTLTLSGYGDVPITLPISYISNSSSSCTINYDMTTYSAYLDLLEGVKQIKQSAVGGTHAEGEGTIASGTDAHAEGWVSTASGTYSHAEGHDTTASGTSSHAEGDGTTASGTSSHAEGDGTTASGSYSHAEGQGSISSGLKSHAEGYNSTAFGDTSHAEGYSTIASGSYSHASGRNTQARYAQTTIGQFNVVSSAPDNSYSATNELLIIGNGTSAGAKGNAFKVLGNGQTYADGAYASTGADYAEYFEWSDGNSESEDRVGYFVTLDGEKIRKANSDDEYIVGVVSSTPSVVGDNHEAWKDRYVTDAWGRIQYQYVDVPAETRVVHHDAVINTEGTVVTEAYDEVIETSPARQDYVPIYNPEWNAEQEYVSREHRKEWSAVGIMGKLLVRDDGTCSVNGYCAPNSDGIATPWSTMSSVKYRVVKRINESIIQILLK